MIQQDFFADLESPETQNALSQQDFFSDLDTQEQQPAQSMDFFSDLEPQQAQEQPTLNQLTRKTFLETARDYFTKPSMSLEEQAPPQLTDTQEKQLDLVNAFKEGLQESTSGEISQAVFNPKNQKKLEKESGFWESLVKEAGTVTGDLPYLAAGATLGGIIGAPVGPIGAGVGAAFGATALPAFLKESLRQYKDFQEKGGDLSFGEFLQRADKIANRTLNEGLFGVILGSVKKAMPLLEKTPGIGKLFSTKLGSTAATVVGEAGLATAVPAAAEGRLPEGKDFAHALALFAGFNLAHLPTKIIDKLDKQGRESGLSPEQFAEGFSSANLEKIKALAKKNIPKVEEPIISEEQQINKNNIKILNKEKITTKEKIQQKIKENQINEKDIEISKLNGFGFSSIGVKTKDGNLIGNIVIGEKGNNIEIENFIVEPEYHGKGVSDILIKNVLEKAKKEGKSVSTSGLTDEGAINLSKILGRKFQEGESVNLTPEDINKILSGRKRFPLLLLEKISKINIHQSEFKSKELTLENIGEGARERIEYPKTGMQKITETMNSFIEEAKTPIETAKRRAEAVNTAIFNALAPLENLEERQKIPVADRVSTRIKLAKSAASEINSVLENGIFSNMTGNFEHGGLKEAYGDLTWKKFTKDMKPDEYSIQDIDVYRTSKIALKRHAEGKKTGIDPNQAKKDIAELKDKYEPIDQKIREFQKATLKEYGKDLLGSELIEKWNSEYYSPLYRVMGEGKDPILSSGSLIPKQPFKKMKGSKRKIIPPSESDPYNTAMLVRNARKNDAVLQYLKGVNEGKLPGRVRKAKIEPMSDTAFEALEVDAEMRKVADQLHAQTRKDSFTPEKNTIRGWKDGKAFDIEVPEDIYDVFSAMAPQERGFMASVFGPVNRLFSKAISMEPRKFLGIVGRDALSSLIYSRTGSNPISVFEAMADIWKGAPVYKEFLALGGDVYASRLAERVDRAHKIEDLIKPAKNKIIVPFEKMGEYFRKYGKLLSDVSLTVPLAEYKRALKKFGDTPDGRLAAAMEARRVVYDPTRKGASKAVQKIGNFIPFWNVSLQDISMVTQNLKRPETWLKGIMAISAPTLLLKMMNEGNDEYESLTPAEKAAAWHIYAGDKHFVIPIPWLLGTAFKAGAEALYDTTTEMLNRGDDRAKDAWNGMYAHFLENVSGAVPPLAQIYLEQTMEKTAPSPISHFFGPETRAPEVIPRRLKGLEPQYQYTSKTSVIARKWAELWGASPVKVEKFIKGLGATSATSLLALTDEIAYFTGMAEDKRPEQREANYLMLGNFVKNSPPSRTKYQNEFYDYLNQLDQRKKSQKFLKETGSEKELEELPYKNVPLARYNRKISKLFREMRAVEDDTKMSPSTKKSYLDSLQREVNELYKEAVQEVREAKK